MTTKLKLPTHVGQCRTNEIQQKCKLWIPPCTKTVIGNRQDIILAIKTYNSSTQAFSMEINLPIHAQFLDDYH